jgi:Protein of unknown function (DUF3616)
MKCGLIGRWGVLPFYLLAFSTLAASAQEPWKVEGKLLGEPKGASGFEKSEDVSGIACDRLSGFPRLCLLADDEAQGAQIVILNEGELIAGDFIKLTNAQFDDKPLELDAEAVAYDDGAFYVVGSHGRPRHDDKNPKKEAKGNAKAEATRQIFRVTLDASSVDMKNGKLVSQPAIKPFNDLSGILQRQPNLWAAYDRALDDNGLTIEGVAVRDKRLYVGMRGPVLGTDAVVLSVPLSALFEGQSAESNLLRLALGYDSLGNPRGVREISRFADGFLVLAGPVNDPPEDREIQPSDYSVYVWDGKNMPKWRRDIPVFGKKVKPEALLPLDGDAQRARVLILFDGPKEGAPRPLEVPLK